MINSRTHPEDRIGLPVHRVAYGALPFVFEIAGDQVSRQSSGSVGSAPHVPTIALSSGVHMPQLGLGLFGPDDEIAANTVVAGLERGYRLLDTAEQYQNEAGVGAGIRRSGVPRAEIFVVTKVGNHQHGYNATLRAYEESLSRLGLDYIDQYLIHWPMTRLNLYMDSWRALETLLEEGRVRSIGVANFQRHHLERALAEGSIVPAVNQIELHPARQQSAARAFHDSHRIATMAWSPLGGNPFGHGNVLDNPLIAAVGAKHGKTGPQAIIRWHLQLGNVAIPKTVT
ncbi:MAG: 2,5-diketo-D-gluconate reductase, partial [Nocardioidaceae bacterium]|nr:2,5-diketo-D-gluconate reductase [Nocardioidaceae bacterium]